MNNEFKTSLADTVFSREDFKEFEQFDFVMKNPLFDNCKRFEVSPQLSINKEDNKNENKINYSIKCLERLTI